MLREIGGVMAVVALTLQAGSDYRGQIEKYRSDRIAELTAPDGWLAVRGLFWLHEGANSAGSDPASEIRLPGRTPKRLGVFTLASRFDDTTSSADVRAATIV